MQTSCRIEAHINHKKLRIHMTIRHITPSLHTQVTGGIDVECWESFIVHMTVKLNMSILKKRWKKRKPNFRSIFHEEDFLRESDSSIEKAVFWTSNFLSVPTSGKSLLNLKSTQERCLKEQLNKMKIVINVGGERFVIAYKTITLYPDTLLASQEIERYFDQKKKEYFFDRDPDMFR